MIKNYFKIAIRNLWKYKLYSVINVAGLMVGITASILTLLWVNDEMSKNQFHEDKDQIVQFLATLEFGDEIETWSTLPYPLVDVLLEKYPFIEQVTIQGNSSGLFNYNGTKYQEDGFSVLPDFFNIFSFSLLNGAQASDLQPGKIFISKSFAEKIADGKSQEQLIGTNITFNQKTEYQIQAIFEDPPSASTKQFSYAINVKDLVKNRKWMLDWGNFNDPVFAKIKPGISIDEVNTAIVNTLNENRPDDESEAQLFAQAYTDRYLYNEYKDGSLIGGRIAYVRIFFFAALFLLLIACINFMNLATARATKRSKEIGVRKAIGANKSSLVIQFFGEAVFITLIAFVLSIALTEFSIPQFNLLVGKEVFLDYTAFNTWATFLGIGLLTSFLAGGYPALFLSSLKINNIIKGSHSFSGLNLRRGLVVVQFVLSIFMIIAAFVVKNQVDYIWSNHQGLDKENVFYFEMEEDMYKQPETFMNELRNSPGVVDACRVDFNPINFENRSNSVEWPGKLETDDQQFCIVNMDHDYIPTMKAEIVEGRNFSRDFPADSMYFILNELAVKKMGIEDPIGHRLNVWGGDGKVVGVVKDFRFNSVHEAMVPLVLRCAPRGLRYAVVRTKSGQSKDAIASAGGLFSKFAPSYIFNYKFVEESFEKMYRSEQMVQALAFYFALIAIFISCLGLLGLSAFVAEQKSKEISIRKILGASVTNIITLLSTDFIKLILISLIIVIPLSWYAMSDWLNGYAFKINLDWKIFAFSGFFALLIALITISLQSFKAAMTSPSDALKND